MASHTKDIGKYGTIESYTASMGKNGYPNKVANTQTLRTRGTKNTTRGNSSSTKMG